MASDPEIVRMCLAYITRKADDPSWNYVLLHAALPESLKALLDFGIDPDVTAADARGTLN